jgi:heme-degrading monooxygenase HmoA
MSVVKINAIQVPAERADEMARRFAARAGEVEKAEGFEEFQLLRPDDDRTTWLVYTRWRDEDAFNAWVQSRAFTQGHAHDRGVQATQAGQGVQATQAGQGVQATQAGHGVQATQAGQGGPVATGSELWSFRVEQRELART